MLAPTLLNGSRAQGEATLLASQQGAATAVALAVAEGQPTAYFVGHNAALKIHTLSTKAQVSICYDAKHGNSTAVSICIRGLFDVNLPTRPDSACRERMACIRYRAVEVHCVIQAGTADAVSPNIGCA